jgi:hypothetical protein
MHLTSFPNKARVTNYPLNFILFWIYPHQRLHITARLHARMRKQQSCRCVFLFGCASADEHD